PPWIITSPPRLPDPASTGMQKDVPYVRSALAIPFPNPRSSPDIPSHGQGATRRMRLEAEARRGSAERRRRRLRARRGGGLATSAVDVLQQRLDRGAASDRVGLRPSIGAQAGACVPFGSFPEVAHGSVDDRDPGAFGDGVPDPQDPRRPFVVAL